MKIKKKQMENQNQNKTEMKCFFFEEWNEKNIQMEWIFF